MSIRDRIFVLLLASILIFLLAAMFASDSILLLLGLFIFLALDPQISNRLKHDNKCFAIKVSLAVVLMVSMFFLFRMLLPDPVNQSTMVAVALLCLGFKLIIFPVYETTP